MPKLKPETQLARREHILDAAEICFSRAGFHRCTMNDICEHADISAGALYGHFASKEELIAGIVERNRAKLADEVAEVAEAPDLIKAMSNLGEHYTMDEPRYRQLLCIEIGCESTRNEAVREIHQSADEFVVNSFRDLFARAKADGKIAPTLDPALLAQLIAVLGDGLFWRRAVDPKFDAETLIPAIIGMIETQLNPIPTAASESRDQSSSDKAKSKNTGAHA